jgi:hypothetical protein
MNALGDNYVPSRAEQAFHSEMLAGADRLKKEIGYNPTRFNQMVGEHGGPEAVRLLLGGRDASDGFTTLWENDRLEMSCEAIALLHWYAGLFSEDERAVARHRLVEHGFDVDGFLQRCSSSTPLWWSQAEAP